MPEFKFSTSQSKRALQKQVRGPNIKRLYTGWTMFFKLAKDYQVGGVGGVGGGW